MDSELLRALTRLDELGIRWDDPRIVYGSMSIMGHCSNGYTVRIEDNEATGGFISSILIADDSGMTSILYRRYWPNSTFFDVISGEGYTGDPESQNHLRSWIAPKVRHATEAAARKQQAKEAESRERFFRSN